MLSTPRSGKVERKLITAANQGSRKSETRGITFAGDDLWVLSIYGRLQRLDVETGAVEKAVETGLRWTFGLTSDGSHLVCASREGLHFVDPETGQVARHVRTNYRLRALTYGRLPGDEAARYHVMEQPVFGFDQRHQRVVTHPARAMIHGLEIGSR